MSSTDPTPTQGPVPVATPLGMKELSVLLVKHYGFHEGLYDLMVEYQIGAGPIGITADQRIPGVMAGVSKVGLAVAKAVGPMTIDAALVNPTRRKAAK